MLKKTIISAILILCVCMVMAPINAFATISEVTTTPANSIKFKLSDAFGDLNAREWKDPVTGINLTVEYSYDNVNWDELEPSVSDENINLVKLSTSQFYAFSNTDKVYMKFNWSTGRNMVSEQFAGLKIGEVYELTEKGNDYFYHIQHVTGKYSLNWAYDNSFGEDAKVTNGTVKVIKIKDGENETNETNNPNNNNGYWRIKKGVEVTLELKPDYGYQLDTAGLNGATVVAGSNVSTFTFTMPETNLHFAAMFKKTDDKMTVAGNDVEEADVDGAENIVSSGNIELKVDDLTVSEDMKTKFENKANENTIVSYLDLNIYNIVYKKSDGTEVWSEQLSELDEEITVTLTLADELSNESGTYYLIREHDGVYENIEAEYNKEDNTLTFRTDKFSEYAVVKNVVKSVVKEKDETPETGETSLIVEFMLVTSIAGAAILIIKKKLSY